MLQEKWCNITQREIFWKENVILVYEIFKQVGFMHSHFFSHGLHTLTLSLAYAHTCKHQNVCVQVDMQVFPFITTAFDFNISVKTSTAWKHEVFGKKKSGILCLNVFYFIIYVLKIGKKIIHLDFNVTYICYKMKAMVTSAEKKNYMW